MSQPTPTILTSSAKYHGRTIPAISAIAGIVIGGTRGIGRAIVLRMAKLGMNMAVLARKQEELDEKGRKRKKTMREKMIQRQADYQKQLAVQMENRKTKAEEKEQRAKEKRDRERAKKIVD